MLWCTETPGHKSNIPPADIVEGNRRVRTHLFAGFLCYNGSWADAVEVYRKAKMYRSGSHWNRLILREAILMTLMALMANERGGEALVDIMKDLFRSWGDQVAAQEGDGLLVSMW